MKRILAFIVACLMVTCLFTGINVNKAQAEEAFTTNMTGWTAADGSTWSVTERGYETNKVSSVEAEPLKFFAKSDTVIDGKKSFKYEISFFIESGYGVGLSLVTIDRENFYAVEVNFVGEVYFPTMTDGSWSTFSPYGTYLTQEEIDAFYNKEHTLTFEYNAEDGSAKVSLDGVQKADAAIPSKALKGNLGLYFEDASVYFTKAEYTELGGEVDADLKKFMETNMDFETTDDISWDYTKKGLMCSTSAGRHVAKSDTVVDGSKSFQYEVTFDYSGYGAGLSFATKDADNFVGIEININREVYFPMREENTWSKYYTDGTPLTEEEAETTVHTILFTYDAYDWYGELYVDGELRSEIYFENPDLISGNLGLFFEDASVTFSKAVYTELETRTDAPATEKPVEEATATPAPTEAPTQVPATEAPKAQEETEENSSMVWIIVAGVVVAIAAAASIVFFAKKKK